MLYPIRTVKGTSSTLRNENSTPRVTTNCPIKNNLANWTRHGIAKMTGSFLVTHESC